MGGNFKIKKQTPIAQPIGSNSEKLVFGFSELKDISYIKGEKDGKFFICFLSRLKKLSLLDWKTVSVSAKHSYGWEIMKVDNMTDAARTKVPAGMDKLLVFRATGDNHVFFGYRNQNIFEVIFIEYAFGDIYRHN